MSRRRLVVRFVCAALSLFVAVLALTARQAPPPTPTPGIAAGASHSVALDASGAVWAWGANLGGQVGDGTTQTRLAPVRLFTLTGTFTAVAAGGAHSLARRSDGSVFAWGLNANGELGVGSLTPRPTPVQIAALSNIIAVAAGATHSLALRANGTVVAFGANSEGQLGDNTTTRRTTPVTVSGLTAVVAIAAGAQHSLALKSDGTVWAWGANGSSQLGDNTTTRRRVPVRVTTLPAAKAIAAGGLHSAAVLQTGAVMAWGGNSSGAVGDGTTTTRRVPVAVPGLSNIATVAAGAAHTTAASATGSHWAWGANLGALGDGTTSTRLSPVAINPPGGVVLVAAGGAHSLALTAAGSVWSTGLNLLGPLGNGSSNSSSQYGPISGSGQTWGATAPVLTPAGGTFPIPQSVTISTPTPGAQIRYTVDGSEPTTGSAQAVSGSQLAVDETTVLKAKAFKAGMTPSSTTAGTFTFQVATPSVAPGTGTYAAPPTVTLATASPGATLYYTLDGSDPTAASTPYTAPIVIPAPGELRVRGFRANWLPSAVASAVYTFNFGTLATPTATPAAGTYPAAQTVSLSADPGATIRYTLDGTDPAPTSTIYSAPLTVAATTTLKAQAYRSGFTPSGVLVAPYVIDTTGSLPPGEPSPPDPSTVAPPLSQVELTPFQNQVSFLYSGPTPIQQGLVPGTLQGFRVAVLRGRVLTRDGQPLPGARVRLADRAEFGYTVTRLDGMFDLVVNGGGPVTLEYTRNGFLPVQRVVDPPWHDYAWAPDVRMVQLDTNVTTADFSVTAPAQVVRGSVQTDASGTRQATLIIPEGGVMAAMTLPNGTVLPNLAHLAIRATEYTVGPNGPDAMPGELPAASGYTYAVEMSADEAIATGATSLTFDPPLPLYVENFLNFPVGGIVPAGYYDRTAQGWLPGDNGRVVQVLAVDGAGRAELDIDGSGQAADAAALASLGVTDGERTRLAAIYTAGQSLWRTPIPHFTPWDCNWPYGPPSTAERPNLDEPATLQNSEGFQNNARDVAGQTCETGSIVGCENQTLGETVPVAGTPFALHYDSGRVASRYSNLDFPVTRAAVSPDLKRVDVAIDVAGQRLMSSFAAAPDLRGQQMWNGNDAYGRRAVGWQDATVGVTHVYDAVYLTPSTFSQSFGRFSDDAVAVGTARTEVGIRQEMAYSVRGPVGAQATLGQWSISPHHSYDDVGQTLYPGTGGQQSAVALGALIRTMAGGGSDAVTATASAGLQARLDGLTAMTVAENGDVYAVDALGIVAVTGSNTVRRVMTFATGAATYESEFSPQLSPAPGGGIYFTRRAISGTCFATGTFDAVDVMRLTSTGAPVVAASVALSSPLPCDAPLGAAIAVGRDGTIYVSAGPDVYRINRGSTVGAPLKSLRPFDLITSMAVARGGEVYVATPALIQRLESNGTLTFIAGRTGAERATITAIGDGGPANEARVGGIQAIAVDREGRLLILEGGTVDPRIRSVGGDGIIQTYAGGGLNPFGGLSPDGTPGRQVQLFAPGGMAVSPDGTVVVNENDGATGGVVRRLQSAYPQNGTTQVIPSSDGGELYEFAVTGRHLRTFDTLTGVALYTFGYDPEGHLATITDREGLVTTIERAAGVATAIVSPFGPRTTLSVVNDQLQSVTDPENQTTTFTYVAGVLATMRDAGGGLHDFDFGARALLESDVDPEGGTQTLSRVASADGWTVTRTQAEVGVTTYTATRLTTGGQERIVTRPDGTQTVTTRAGDGTTVTVAPDGTTATATLGPDPRFGLAAPLVTQATVQTPNGLQMTSSTARAVVLTVPDNPLSLTSATDTTTVNGRVYSSLFTAATRTITSTSPEGRTTVTTLDALGRPSSVQVGDLTPTAFHYDAQGRLRQRVQGSRTTTFNYDSRGYLDQVTDPLTRTVSFTNDAIGRALTQTFPDTRVASFRYDGNSNLRGLTPPGRPEHQFDYTGVNLLQTYRPPTAPAAGPTGYTYDTARRPRVVTRADGQTLNFAYEIGTGRLESLTTPSGVTSYGYEPGTGRLATVTAPGADLAYAYDGALLLSETWSGSVQGDVAWTYDNDFRITNETVQGGHGVNFGYDNDGLLMSAGDTSYTRVTATGLLDSSTVGSVATSFGYNGFGELTSHATSVGGAPVYAATLGRDAGGRIQQQTEVLGGVTTTDVYGYDPAGRLHTVTRNGTLAVTYGYDANGNRNTVTTAAGSVSATFDNQDRILTFGTRTYTHTPHGDVAGWTDSATSTTTTLTYDVQGNVRQFQQPGTTITYTVDGRNRRIGTAVNGMPVQGFLWQGQLRPVAELDGSGNLVSRFVYGTRINVPEYMERGGTTYRLVTDHLGSVRLVIDTSTDQVVQALTYDPWGVVVQDTNPGFQPFGYAGGLYDHRTGLVRFGVRDYDATVGRWLAKDPIGFDGNDANLFSYGLGDPVNHVDPQGTDVWSAIASAARGVVEGVVGGVVVGAAIASGTAVGAAVAVGAVGYGSFRLGQGVFEVATGTDWSTGRSIATETRIDIAAELIGGAAGGALFCASGPAGPIFGRGKYRNGSPGVLNQGDRLRLGWSWDQDLGRNMFGPHGGVPKTPSHWHGNIIPGPKGPTLGPFRW